MDDVRFLSVCAAPASSSHLFVLRAVDSSTGGVTERSGLRGEGVLSHDSRITSRCIGARRCTRGCRRTVHRRLRRGDSRHGDRDLIRRGNHAVTVTEARQIVRPADHARVRVQRPDPGFSAGANCRIMRRYLPRLRSELRCTGGSAPKLDADRQRERWAVIQHFWRGSGGRVTDLCPHS